MINAKMLLDIEILSQNKIDRNKIKKPVTQHRTVVNDPSNGASTKINRATTSTGE